MRVAVALTSKAIFYYSNSGHTKEAVIRNNTDGFDVYNFKDYCGAELEPLFKKYSTILIGTSTTGKGVPHSYFRAITPLLNRLKDKEIGLFGSGQTIYGDNYCGALDLLDDFLGMKNKIIFKFKFESFPTEEVIEEFGTILDKIRGD
jgi:flavodoxin I